MIGIMLYEDASILARGAMGTDMLGSLLPALRTLIGNLELPIARYLVPLSFAALMVIFVVWRLQRQEWERVCKALKQATELKQQAERERNQAQAEVFRRLHEDSELSKEKFQFQAQLAEVLKNTRRSLNWLWVRHTE